ncbi:hypothetical protein C7410_114166 [Paraburkholderia silvatlantica]|uniref:Uncharacterized protein n=1 Tax=Paraburkholderia silvatlantica TaxID=321895 RepID=A0A2V4TSI1_9BURK|nr:hypothetical protein C7410_114166 [Paraburkholderia silvatlantica]
MDILPCGRLALLTYIKKAKRGTPGSSNATKWSPTAPGTAASAGLDGCIQA